MPSLNCGDMVMNQWSIEFLSNANTKQRGTEHSWGPESKIIDNGKVRPWAEGISFQSTLVGISLDNSNDGPRESHFKVLLLQFHCLRIIFLNIKCWTYIPKDLIGIIS